MLRRQLPVWVFTAALLWSVSASAQVLMLRGTLNLGSCTAVDAVNTVAYTTLSGSFRSIDLTDPDHPALLGQVPTGAATVSALEVSGSFAFGAGQADGLVIVNISNPSSPTLVTRYSLGNTVRDIAVSDTLVAVATPLNITLVGVRNPAAPHVLATYGHAASWIEFDNSGRRLHVGSTTGAFSLDITVNTGGGDTTFAIALGDEYGSDALTPVALAGNYVDVVRSSTLVALHAANYTSAGQRTSSAAIRALTAGTGFCFTALATGTLEYIDQRSDIPQLVTTVAIAGTPNALAMGQSGTQHLLIAAYSNGIAVYEYGALAADDPAAIILPAELRLSAFPNPFNGTVSLMIEPPHPGTGELRIFDLLGREVQRDIIELTGATERIVDFGSRPSGLYLAELRQGSFSTTVKLLYIP